MNIFLPLNWQSHHKFVSSLIHLSVNDYTHNLTQYETKDNSKIPSFQQSVENYNLS